MLDEGTALASNGGRGTESPNNDARIQKGSLKIISATYGKLGPSAKDITRQVQEIVYSQGGSKLELKEGSKRHLFSESKSKHKAHLCIVYVDASGNTQRKSFKDEEAVYLAC
jgi:hypothetical protein